MSFLGGAECSTAANPLAQFSKIGSDDKSLQRDRLVGRNGPQQGMRSAGMNAQQDNVSMPLIVKDATPPEPDAMCYGERRGRGAGTGSIETDGSQVKTSWIQANTIIHR
jgi:peroxin-5